MIKKINLFLVPIYILLTIFFVIAIEGILTLLTSSFPQSASKHVLVQEYRSPYIYTFVPNSTAYGGGATNTHITHINNFAIRRSSDIHAVPDENTTRILSYGDSIGFGIRVNDQSAYPNILEQLLNNKHPGHFEILNMARGCSPSIYAFHLQKDIKNLKPKMVIMEIELLNDISDEAMIRYAKTDEHGLPQALDSSRYYLTWDQKTVSGLNIKGFFFERTRLWVLMSRLVGFVLSGWDKNPVFSTSSDQYYYNLGFDRWYLTKDRLGESFERMFSVIKSTQEYCHARGIKFLLLILPSKYALYKNIYQQSSMDILDKARQRAVRLGIDHVSLKDAFQAAGPKVFLDFCHPNPQGYRIIAQETYKYIITHND